MMEQKFQSPKSGHIVCNKTKEELKSLVDKFQSPKSGHIVCNLELNAFLANLALNFNPLNRVILFVTFNLTSFFI